MHKIIADWMKWISATGILYDKMIILYTKGRTICDMNCMELKRLVHKNPVALEIPLDLAMRSNGEEEFIYQLQIYWEQDSVCYRCICCYSKKRPYLTRL